MAPGGTSDTGGTRGHRPLRSSPTNEPVARPRTRGEVGRRGEQLAARYLQTLGWRIVQRNWRCRRGELDLVAREGQWLVVVEVRTRTGDRFGTPAASVTAAKQARLAELGARFVRSTGWQGPWRIDVVTVQMPGDAAPQIEHYRHAVGGP